MPVAKLFWIDPYLTQNDAIITSVCGNKVTVDKTVAYAMSGGQDSDSGTISQYKILKAEKNDKEIIYFIDPEHRLVVGDNVIIKIDWQKRYRLMKLHFAAELILELVYQNFNRPNKIGANISEDKARVDFQWQGNISEIFPFLQEKLEELIDSDYKIISDYSDEEEQKRYWEIKGFAKVPCGGTHLDRTNELGKLNLKRKNLGSGKERIEITLM
ncbi:alanyl-tRNA editing protein [Clostridium botulinum]|uniref:alanyl-tRNA editing protein n=1 Tax=Clostridium botulinum TaxID=1491 RepID=UPI00174E54F9|nr:alanyl-tRNA editing protein [Clostridium botulinum]MBD5637148.1 alanyl-tRNA editing protein [Clostridium botulinum]